MTDDGTNLYGTLQEELRKGEFDSHSFAEDRCEGMAVRVRLTSWEDKWHGWPAR